MVNHSVVPDFKFKIQFFLQFWSVIMEQSYGCQRNIIEFVLTCSLLCYVKYNWLIIRLNDTEINSVTILNQTDVGQQVYCSTWHASVLAHLDENFYPDVGTISQIVANLEPCFSVAYMFCGLFALVLCIFLQLMVLDCSLV